LGGIGTLTSQKLISNPCDREAMASKQTKVPCEEEEVEEIIIIIIIILNLFSPISY